MNGTSAETPVGNDPLNHLEQHREAIWRKLARREPRLVRQLEEWDDAIAKLKGTRGEYSNLRSGADAVVAYIREHGPKRAQDICVGVVTGGWRGDHPDAYWKLWDAIQYQLKRSTNAKIISLGDGIIGLPEHRKSRKK